MPAGYELLGVIGRGGMGVVYKAYDRGLGRTVAIKMIQAGNDITGLRRLKTEAQALAEAAHPNIVAVLKMENLGVQSALVMEYVDGVDLAKFIEQRGPLPPQVARQVLRQVASALRAAHAHNIVHRDLKPANILIAESGGKLEVKVVDFGIAKFVDGEGQRLTKTGTIVGSPEYISPEVCRAEQPDQRSDIYSLGIVAFTMLSGKPPFTGDSSFELILKHMDERVPEANCPTDSSLAAIISKCTEPAPANRFQTAEELLAAEADPKFRHEPAKLAQKQAKPKLHNKFVGALGIALLLGLVVTPVLKLVAKPPHSTTAPAQEAYDKLTEIRIVHQVAPPEIVESAAQVTDTGNPNSDARRHKNIGAAYAELAEQAHNHDYALKAYSHLEKAISLNSEFNFNDEEIMWMGKAFLACPDQQSYSRILTQLNRDLRHANFAQGRLRRLQIELDMMALAYAMKDEPRKTELLKELRQQVKANSPKEGNIDDFLHDIAVQISTPRLDGIVPYARGDKVINEALERWPNFPFNDNPVPDEGTTK